jgi:hypothetical protein
MREKERRGKNREIRGYFAALASQKTHRVTRALTMIKEDTGDEALALQAPRSLQQKHLREEKASANRGKGEAGFWREAQGPGGSRFSPS